MIFILGASEQVRVMTIMVKIPGNSRAIPGILKTDVNYAGLKLISHD
jgi:hypothetical protein